VQWRIEEFSTGGGGGRGAEGAEGGVVWGGGVPGGGVPLPTGGGVWGGGWAPSPEKIEFGALKCRILVQSGALL